MNNTLMKAETAAELITSTEIVVPGSIAISGMLTLAYFSCLLVDFAHSFLSPLIGYFLQRLGSVMLKQLSLLSLERPILGLKHS